MSDSEGVFIIEKICAHQPSEADNQDGATSYTIHWKNYTEEERTNEPAETIIKDAPLLVKKYWKDFHGQSDTEEEQISGETENQPDEPVAEKGDAEEESDDDAEYEVDKIVSHLPKTAKKHDEVEQYEIKWKGYSASDNTTEDKDGIPETAIKKYWSKKEDKSSKDVSKKRKASSKEQSPEPKKPKKATTAGRPKTSKTATPQQKPADRQKRRSSSRAKNTPTVYQAAEASTSKATTSSAARRTPAPAPITVEHYKSLIASKDAEINELRLRILAAEEEHKKNHADNANLKEQLKKLKDESDKKK